jgi:hypothetical protein
MSADKLPIAFQNFPANNSATYFPLCRPTTGPRSGDDNQARPISPRRMASSRNSWSEPSRSLA